MLLSSYPSNYDSILKEKILGPFQIKIVQKLFKEGFSKNLSYTKFLRAVMAETQCNHSVVINSFNENLMRLGAASKYQDKEWIFYHQLVAYNDFDEH